MSVYRPLVIIGPSGSGKSTLAHHLVDTEGFVLAKTYTTRQRRDAENDDDHIFVDKETFITMKKDNQFLGTLSTFGADYGLPFLDTTIKNIVLLRAPAVKQFLAQYKNSYVVHVTAPLDTLVERLKKRNSLDRIDEKFLLAEIEAGNTLADITIMSTVSIFKCAALVMKEYRHV